MKIEHESKYGRVTQTLRATTLIRIGGWYEIHFRTSEPIFRVRKIIVLVTQPSKDREFTLDEPQLKLYCGANYLQKAKLFLIDNWTVIAALVTHMLLSWGMRVHLGFTDTSPKDEEFAMVKFLTITLPYLTWTELPVNRVIIMLFLLLLDLMLGIARYHTVSEPVLSAIGSVFGIAAMVGMLRGIFVLASFV